MELVRSGNGKKVHRPHCRYVNSRYQIWQWAADQPEHIIKNMGAVYGFQFCTLCLKGWID